MRYEMPTDADKQLLQPSPSANREGKKMYTKTLVSFQLTGATNLLRV